MDKKGGTYEERLESIGLTTLVERRERGDAIETFKTINGFNRVDKTGWFCFLDATNSRATRSTVSIESDGQQERKDVLFMESVRLDSRKNFFTVRTVGKWNEISDEVKSRKSINSFRTGTTSGEG